MRRRRASGTRKPAGAGNQPSGEALSGLCARLDASGSRADGQEQEKPVPEMLTKEEARQGETSGHVRYVLMASLLGAIAALTIVGVIWAS